MEELLSLKNTSENFEVIYDILPSIDIGEACDQRQIEISKALNDVEARLDFNYKRIAEINSEVDRLTSHADGIDYMVAVGSGIIAGIIDSLWVGEFSFERGKDISNKQVNNFVVKIAQSQGYKGEDLGGAIEYLESKKRHNNGAPFGFGAPSDSVTSEFGGGLQHHLRDFAHHPTFVGLAFSILTQFTSNAYGTNTEGMFQIIKVTNDKYIGKDIPQKLLFGVVYWFFHMVSDMAGSSNTPGAGTGLPGPILSLAKELSVLPFFKNIKIGDNEFSVWISKLFNGTLLGKRDNNGKLEPLRFDLRAEIGVANELLRQAVPVVINECIVRGFYFIRRLCFEIKEKNIKSFSEFENIDWEKTLPFRNRTVVRMLTISTGTFTAIDLADATVRSALKSGGFNAAFLSNFILRVNFVGVGRFAIALGSDVSMGLKRQHLSYKRIGIYNEQINLYSVKVFYKQADMWIAAENTEKTIEEAYRMIEKTTDLYIESIQKINENLENISGYAKEIDKKNPELIESICDILKWG